MRPGTLCATALIVIIAWSGIGVAQTKPTLHLIAVADTEDGLVGKEFGLNNEEIKRYAGSLAGTTDLVLDVKEIAGKDYSCSNINAAVKNLSAQPNDVVIFYHSGHGTSPKKDISDKAGSKFPSLQCTTDLTAALPNLEDISNALRKKGARLTITAADSCNRLPEQELAPLGKAAILPPRNRIRTMFLNFKGYILISGASTDEFAFYKRNDSGEFTKQFLNALDYPPNVKPELLWQEVLDRASKVLPTPNHAATPPEPPMQEFQHPQHVEELTYVPPVVVSNTANAVTARAAAPKALEADKPKTKKKKRKKKHHHVEETSRND
ncbi:MAG: caspase family protein [Rhodomicrobium sp.]